MAILFEDNETVAAPPPGKRYLKTDADGNLVVVSPDATESPAGAVQSVSGPGIDDTDPANPETILATNLLPGMLAAAARSADKRTSAVALTGANQTIQPFTDACSRYILPAGALSGNAAVTLGVTGAVAGRVCEIVILDTSVSTYLIKNNAGDTIAQKGISDPAQTFQVYLNGADWVASTSWYAGV